jgi:hypothetical protein
MVLLWRSGGIALKAPGWGSGKRRRFVFDAREKTCRADYDTESFASIWLQWSYGGVERSNSGQIWAYFGVSEVMSLSVVRKTQAPWSGKSTTAALFPAPSSLRPHLFLERVRE